MPLRLVQLGEGMAADCTAIYLAAFDKNAANQAMLPQRNVETLKYLTKRESELIRNRGKDEFSKHDHYWAVVDTSVHSHNPSVPEGQIIAFCKWKYETPERQSAPEAAPEEIPGGNKAARKHFFEVINGMRHAHTEGKSYWHLSFLATSPKHAGKGAGTVCLNWGIRKAAEDGLDCYLDSTPAGKGLYEKVGFEVLEEREVDFSAFGFDIDYTTYSMIKRPDTKAEAPKTDDAPAQVQPTEP